MARKVSGLTRNGPQDSLITEGVIQNRSVRFGRDETTKSKFNEPLHNEVLGKRIKILPL